MVSNCADNRLLQADYDYPDLMDSFPSNHKKGYKKRQSKSVADEEEEEEENQDDMQEYMALPFNHDSEDPDPEFDPKVRFPLPKEVQPFRDFSLFMKCNRCRKEGCKNLPGRSCD